MLDSQSLQGPSEFQQEVNFLIKLRHPNIVNLIGTCPEAFILVYECLLSGSLEDRLVCVGNTPPLSWQTRIRIAAELCGVLIFLHSCKPDSIVHGDLKPGNILLDGNYVCKLGDFGIGRAITQNELSSNDTTLCRRTDPKGTFAYMDPEFVATGVLTTKSDVYSFGIILLRLLTGRPAVGLPTDVQNALANNNLEDLLDDTAGDWPFVIAEQLACLAMRCCETNRRSQPELALDVWRVLEPMTISCGAPSFTVSPVEHRQIPSYFVCPILQVRKILRSLPKAWEAKVTAIQEAKDLNTLALDELLGSLMTYELTQKQHAQDDVETKRKPVAFKSSTQEDESSSEEDDGEMALSTRKFKRFMKKKWRRGKRHDGKGEANKESTIICYECNKLDI